MESKHYFFLGFLILFALILGYFLFWSIKKAIIKNSENDLLLARREADIYFKEVVKLSSLLEFYRSSFTVGEPKPMRVN